MSGVLLACGGESTEFNKHGSDDDSGGSGAQGATGGAPRGGATSTGGSGPAGTGGAGGSTEPPDGVCEDITPCGGDPQGSWNVRDSCFELLVPIFPDEPGCEDIIGAATADVSGTFTFDNGALTNTLTTSLRMTFLLHDACAQSLVGSPDVAAADVCPLLDAELSMNPDTPGTCAVATGGCRCDITTAPTTETNTGTYQIVGNQLVDETGSAIDFCQRDDELHLHSEAVDVATSSLGALTLLLDRVQ